MVYLGYIKQRIPLFANNDKGMERYVRRNNGRDYEICDIPTYLITQVFLCEALWVNLICYSLKSLIAWEI